MSIAVDRPPVNVLRSCPVCRRTGALHLVNRRSGHPEPVCHRCKQDIAKGSPSASRPPRPTAPAGTCPECCDPRIWMFSASAGAYQPVCPWCASDALEGIDPDAATVLEPTPLESHAA